MMGTFAIASPTVLAALLIASRPVWVTFPAERTAEPTNVPPRELLIAPPTAVTGAVTTEGALLTALPEAQQTSLKKLNPPPTGGRPIRPGDSGIHPSIPGRREYGCPSPPRD